MFLVRELTLHGGRGRNQIVEDLLTGQVQEKVKHIAEVTEDAELTEGAEEDNQNSSREAVKSGVCCTNESEGLRAEAGQEAGRSREVASEEWLATPHPTPLVCVLMIEMKGVCWPRGSRRKGGWGWRLPI